MSELERFMAQSTLLCATAWPEDRRNKQLSKSYIAQLAEEVGELAKACRRFWGRSLRPEESEQGNNEPIIEEAGDVLFVVLRICWLYRVNPTMAIQQALDKFEVRLKKVEAARRPA